MIIVEQQQFSSLGENSDDKHGAQLFTHFQESQVDWGRPIDTDKTDAYHTFGMIAFGLYWGLRVFVKKSYTRNV